MTGFLIFLCIGFIALGFCFGRNWEKQSTRNKANALIDVIDNCMPEDSSDFSKTYNKGLEAIKSLIESYFLFEE